MSQPHVTVKEAFPDTTALIKELSEQFPGVHADVLYVAMANAATMVTLESLGRVAPHPVILHAIDIVAGNLGALLRSVGENHGMAVENISALCETALKQADEQVLLARQARTNAPAANEQGDAEALVPATPRVLH